MKNSFVADSTLIKALEHRAVSVPCVTGHQLFKQGEVPIGLYLLRSGKASLVMTAEDGEEVLRLTVGPGSILGVPAVVGRDFYTLSATACPGAEVGFVAQKNLRT